MIPKKSRPKAQKYDRAVVSQLVLDGMSDKGLSANKACAAAGVPLETFRTWAREDVELATKYAQAREALVEKMAAEILEIADDGKNDTYVDDNGRTVIDHDVIARSRLRVDARKWLLSKIAPKKYGDKVEVDHTGTVKIDAITRKVVDPTQPLTIDQKLTERAVKAIKIDSKDEENEDV